MVSLCFSQAPAQSEEAAATTWDDVVTSASALLEEEKFDEALDVWERGLDDGYFYFAVPRFPVFDTVRKTDRFRTLLDRNNELREKANKGSKPEFKVITPASYSPDRSYPLVMIIHGGNQSIVKAMGRWDPQVIGDEFLIAYVQSSFQADTKSYRWDLGGLDIFHRPMAQDEVLGLYREIVEEYPVDTEQVTIFVGSEDWTAAPVATTVANFTEAGLTVHHMLMEGKGHEFPDEFDAVLREALEDIHP